MASSEEEPSKICIYCYKAVAQDNQLENRESHDNFLTLIKRLFNLSRRNAFCSGSGVLCSNELCNDCFGIVTNFCKLYDQIKGLELQLNWQVDKLLNVMKWADRVPSRLKQFKTKDNDFERKLKFRKKFKRTCKTHLESNFPRVSLPRLCPPGNQQEFGQIADVDVSVPTQVPILPIVNEGENDVAKRSRCILLGWISSFTALIFLYNLDIPNPKSPQLLDDGNLEKELLVISESQPRSLLVDKDDDEDDSNHEYDNTTLQSDIESGSMNEEDFSESQDIFHERAEVLSPVLTEPEPQPQSPSSLMFTSNDDENIEIGRDVQIAKQEVATEVFHVSPFLNFEVPYPEAVSEEQSPANLRLSTENLVEPIVPDPCLVQIADTGDYDAKLGPFLELNSVQEASSKPIFEGLDSPTNPSLTRVTSTEESFLVPRRRLRTKYQCSKCKATFSDGAKFEFHSKSCSQSIDTGSGTDSDDEEFKANTEMSSKTPEKHKIRPKRSSITKARQLTVAESGNNDNSTKTDDDDDDSSSSSDHGLYLDDRYFQTCTKCVPKVTFKSFGHRAYMKYHERYKHSKGHFQLNPPEADKLGLTHNSLNLEGINMETNFQCDHCSTTFLLLEELENHTKLYGDFTCLICDFAVSNAIELINHELEHNNEKEKADVDKQQGETEILQCIRCPFKIRTKKEFINHHLSEHLGLPPIQSKCAICQRRFLYEASVPITHYINFHDLNRLDDPADRFNCNKQNCSAYFLKEDQLHFHWNVEHNIMENKIARVEKAKKIKLWKRSETKNHSCPHCDMKFYYPTLVRTHISTVHQSKKSKHHSRELTGDIVITKDGLTISDIVLKTKAKYFCKVDGCKEKFIFEQDLQSHSKLHGDFPCNFCPVVKTFATDLAAHELVHVENGSKVKASSDPEKMNFRCSRCSFSHGRKGMYIEHFVWKHLDLKVDKMKCPVCSHAFVNNVTGHSGELRGLKSSLHKHYIEWHDLTRVPGSGTESSQNCGECSAYFRSKIQLMEHIDEIHINPRGSKDEDVEGYVCRDCGINYSSRRAVRNHRVEVHKVELNFSCDVSNCGKMFETMKQLIYHSRYVHIDSSSFTLDPQTGKKWTCEHCSKIFFSRITLNSHVNSIHKAKKVPSLTATSKPHICEECGKSFKIKQCLETHLKFHKGTDLWDFTCEVCGKKIFSKQKLTEHMRVHTKEKPFVCQVCGAAYGHRHNLRNHVNSKHKEMKDIAQKRDTTNLVSKRKGKKLK